MYAVDKPASRADRDIFCIDRSIGNAGVYWPDTLLEGAEQPSELALREDVVMISGIRVPSHLLTSLRANPTCSMSKLVIKNRHGKDCSARSLRD